VLCCVVLCCVVLCCVVLCCVVLCCVVLCCILSHSIVLFHSTSSTGDPDMYVQPNSLPTFSSNTYTNLECDNCPQGSTSHQLLIPQSALQVGTTFYIGMYGFCCDASVFDLSLEPVLYLLCCVVLCCAVLCSAVLCCVLQYV